MAPPVPKRLCIVCGRPIPARRGTVHIRPTTGWSPNHDGPRADLKTVQDCRRYTNFPYITALRRNPDGMIHTFSTWDGETFDDKYFCTNKCAIKQGRAAAHHGHRFTWKD